MQFIYHDIAEVINHKVNIILLVYIDIASQDILNLYKTKSLINKYLQTCNY